MTWDQLRTLAATGLVDGQSHSYWHPTFTAAKRPLLPAAYRAFALTQLTRSKTVLEQQLGVNVDVIAWPFGVYDDELLQSGADAGDVAGVTLDRRVATTRDPIMPPASEAWSCPDHNLRVIPIDAPVQSGRY